MVLVLGVPMLMLVLLLLCCCAPRPRLRIGETYVVHEALAHDAHVFVQGGAEHHDLLVDGRHLEDLLHIGAHVCAHGGER